MKRLLICFLAIAVTFGFALSASAGGSGDPKWEEHLTNAKKAQALKAEGNYLGAEEVHPYNLCKAIYLWNHACSLVGVRDANGRWAYSEKKSANNVEALKYLDEAELLLKTDDGFGCKGVDPDELQRLIDLVRRQIQLNA